MRPHAHSGSSGDSCQQQGGIDYLQRIPQACFHSVPSLAQIPLILSGTPSPGHRLSPASTPVCHPFPAPLPLSPPSVPPVFWSQSSSSGSELCESGCPCRDHASASICIADSFLFLALSSTCTFCPRLVILFDVILFYFHHLPLSKINLFFSLACFQQNASSGRADADR